MASKTTEIVDFATARARPGKEGDLERTLHDVVAPTQAQRGCLEFQICRSGTVLQWFRFWCPSPPRKTTTLAERPC